MFKTKSDVDKYVSKSTQGKNVFKDSSELLRIARMYFEIREYETSKNYLVKYLSESSANAVAYKLMAEISEAQHNMSKAIEYYSKYYGLEPQAYPILLKICSCYLKLDKDFDKAIHWLEKAEKEFPFYKQVTDLKEKIYNSDKSGAKLNEWQEYLQRAIKENEYDETLKLKLIECYIKASKHDELISLLINTEIQRYFISSVTWYDSVHTSIQDLDSLVKNDDAKLLKLLLLTHTIFAYLENKDDLLSIKTMLTRLDIEIYKLDKEMNASNGDYKSEILSELKAALLFQVSLYFIKSYYLETSSKSIMSLCNICFILSTNESKPNVTRTKNNVELAELAYFDTCWRYSIIGNWLQNASNDDQMEFIQDLKSYSENKNIKKEILMKLYGENHENNGFLNNIDDSKLLIDDFSFVNSIALEYTDKICLNNNCCNLKYIIWYSLVNIKKYPIESPKFLIPNINELPFGVDNLSYTIINTLSWLDIIVYLYACLLQSYSYAKSTAVLPFWIQSNLCTKDQFEWWSACMKKVVMGKILNKSVETTIISGLEIIRLNRNATKKMNFEICVKIGEYLNRIYNRKFDEDIDTYTNEFIDSIGIGKSIISPIEKLKYVDAYALQYWSYIGNYIQVVSKTADNLRESLIEKIPNQYFSIYDDSHYDQLFSDDNLNSKLTQLSTIYLIIKKFIQEKNYKAANQLLNEIKFDQDTCVSNLKLLEEFAVNTCKEENHDLESTQNDEFIAFIENIEITTKYIRKCINDIKNEYNYFKKDQSSSIKPATKPTLPPPSPITFIDNAEDIVLTIKKSPKGNESAIRIFDGKNTIELKSTPKKIEILNGVINTSNEDVEQQQQQQQLDNLSSIESHNLSTISTQTTEDEDKPSLVSLSGDETTQFVSMNSNFTTNTTNNHSTEFKTPTSESINRGLKTPSPQKQSPFVSEELKSKLNESIKSGTGSVQIKSELAKPIEDIQLENKPFATSEPTNTSTISSTPASANNLASALQLLQTMNAQQSVKWNLYRDTLTSQYRTINQQNEQIKNEIQTLKSVINKLKQENEL